MLDLVKFFGEPLTGSERFASLFEEPSLPMPIFDDSEFKLCDDGFYRGTLLSNEDVTCDNTKVTVAKGTIKVEFEESGEKSYRHIVHEVSLPADADASSLTVKGSKNGLQVSVKQTVKKKEEPKVEEKDNRKISVDFITPQEHD